MATIRELERLDRVAASVQDQRIVLGQYGGLGALVRQIAQELRSNGTRVVAIDEPRPVAPSGSRQPLRGQRVRRVRAAGQAGGDDRLLLHGRVHVGGGQSLAQRLAGAFGTTWRSDATRPGCGLTVLRETRMTGGRGSLGR